MALWPQQWLQQAATTLEPWNRHWQVTSYAPGESTTNSFAEIRSTNDEEEEEEGRRDNIEIHRIEGGQYRIGEEIEWSKMLFTAPDGIVKPPNQ